MAQLTRDELKDGIRRRITDDYLGQNTAELVRVSLEEMVDSAANPADDGTPRARRPAASAA
jgi:hypothetical protein